MSFTQYLTETFKNFKFANVVEIFILIALLMFVYCYSSAHNGNFFSVICIILSTLSFLLTFFAGKAFSLVAFTLLVLMQLISFVIFFRNELRRDIFKIGLKGHIALFEHDHSHDVMTQEEIEGNISHIVRACQNMSKSEVGALIVIVKDDIYDYIIESGTIINAKITSELLETIFFPKSPLHDGAVIIKGDRILAAGCYLPLSQDNSLPKEFGTRHRAAYGLTESHPTLSTIVVSEETGIITAMCDKHYKRYLDSATLTKVLKISYNVAVDSAREAFWGGVEDNAE